MGGSSRGPRPIGDVKGLVARAKEELRGKRNVFISFAYEDIGEVNLLRGQAKNENVPIEFNDWSVPEAYDSTKAEYIKQRISERIAQSSVTVVYLSPSAAASKWVAWEVERSVELGKHVIAVHAGDRAPVASFPALVVHKVPVVPWSRLAATVAALP